VIRHVVLTPEKVPFSYRVAGLGSRSLAWLIDAAFLLLLLVMGQVLAAPIRAAGRPGLAVAIGLLSSWLLVWGYFLVFEWLWGGQTPGKRILGIRVIHWNGTAISFSEAAVRNLLRAVDSVPIPVPLGCGLLGFVVAACNRENRRLGDLAANTLVVYLERRAKPIRALQDARTEADRGRVAVFRQRLAQLDREQKQALLDLCLRRDQLRVTERARLFQAAAHFVQGRLDLAPEAYESDEKFVLQLGAVLGERDLPAPEARRTRPGR
jgi:uncharacterized RDD family membrane protein YckC